MKSPVYVTRPYMKRNVINPTDGIDDDNRHLSEDNVFILKEDKVYSKKQQRNEEIGLSQKYYQHQFDFELVQDGDRSPLFSSFCERFIDN